MYLPNIMICASFVIYRIRVFVFVFLFLFVSHVRQPADDAHEHDHSDDPRGERRDEPPYRNADDKVQRKQDPRRYAPVPVEQKAQQDGQKASEKILHFPRYPSVLQNTE